MPTANLAAGLGLLNMPFDGPPPGTPAVGAAVTGDGPSGSSEGFPALLADQIKNTKNAAHEYDKKENKTDYSTTLVVAIGPAVASQVTPPVQPLALPEAAIEGIAPGIAPAPAGVGPPELPVAGAGSALPAGRQVRAEGLPAVDRDWLGSQLEALGRERLVEPVVMPPGVGTTAPGQALRDAPVPGAGAPVGAGVEPRMAFPSIVVTPVSGSADTAPPATVPLAPADVDELAAPTAQAVVVVADSAGSAIPPVAGRYHTPGSAASAAPRELPELPAQAARALPAAAFLHADQSLPPAAPRADVMAVRPGTRAEPTADSRQPALATHGMTTRPGAGVAPVAQAGEQGAAPPAAASTPVLSAGVAATGPGPAGDREVPGSGPRTADPASNVPARGAPAFVSTGEPAMSSHVPVREVAPAAGSVSWLAAQMASAAPAPRPALPAVDAASRGAVPEGTPLPPGVANAVSPMAVAGDGRTAAGTTLAQLDPGRDSDSEPRADAFDPATRGTGLPGGGSPVATVTHPRADAAIAPALNQPLQLASAGFGENLGQRILWLSGNNLKSADIQLDPPELGPLQITVQAHRDGTTVHFTTHSAQAREAVEATLPRLRELLEGSGAGTVDVNLAHQQQPDARAGRPEGNDAAGAVSRVARPEHHAMAAPPRVRQGLIDDYA